MFPKNLFWDLYESLEMLTKYIAQMEFQSEERALLMLLFTDLANTNAKLKEKQFQHCQ